MAAESSEQRIRNLEREMERLKATIECERLLGRYAYLHVKGRREEIVAMYAQKTPGVRVQLGDLGIWEGIEGVKKAWVGLAARDSDQDTTGSMFLHPTTTPYIEVAGDGKTAKGVWISPGIITGKVGATGTLKAIWAWGSMGVDFVKEDGQWKFWHFHIYSLVATPFDRSWAEPDTSTGMVMELPDELKPDKQPVDECPYSTTEVFDFKPEPPEPYETFDEKIAY